VYHRAVAAAMASFNWIPLENGAIMPGVVPGGTDKNGKPRYVGRGWYIDETIPGMISPEDGCAYIGYKGEEVKITSYKALVFVCDDGYAWEKSRGGQIPFMAVPGGQTLQGETLFVGRVSIDGRLQVGKVYKSNGHCFIPYNGKELKFEACDVLVEKYPACGTPK